jgi:hypothetical protein
MILKTMWGQRASERGDMPELMVAWDEYSEDGYPEGFAKECSSARESWGDDLAAWRMVDIYVPSEQMVAAFRPAVASASVIVPHHPGHEEGAP